MPSSHARRRIQTSQPSSSSPYLADRWWCSQCALWGWRGSGSVWAAPPWGLPPNLVQDPVHHRCMPLSHLLNSIPRLDFDELLWVGHGFSSCGIAFFGSLSIATRRSSGASTSSCSTRCCSGRRNHSLRSALLQNQSLLRQLLADVPDVSDMLNLLRCTISTTSQSDENYVTIDYNYVLEAMCRWSKGCAGASDENGWSSHREER